MTGKTAPLAMMASALAMRRSIACCAPASGINKPILNSRAPEAEPPWRFRKITYARAIRPGLTSLSKSLITSPVPVPTFNNSRDEVSWCPM